MLIRLRFRFSEVFFGMLLAGAIFALGSAFWSQATHNGEFAQQPSTTPTTNSRQQDQPEKGWQDPIAILTFGLILVGIFQAGLFYFQLRLIRKSLIEAKIAAEAAKDAADAAKEQTRLAREEFAATHRPRKELREVYIYDEKIWFRLVNVGDTKATVIESYVMTEIPVVKSALIPLLSTGKNCLNNLTFVGGEMKELPYEPRGDHIFVFKTGERNGSLFIGDIYFMGTVVYIDDLKTKRRSVFCRRWHPAERRFVRMKTDEERDYEYAD